MAETFEMGPSVPASALHMGHALCSTGSAGNHEVESSKAGKSSLTVEGSTQADQKGYAGEELPEEVLKHGLQVFELGWRVATHKGIIVSCAVDP